MFQLINYITFNCNVFEEIHDSKDIKTNMKYTPAKRVQHFIQHHTTLMLYEMLHSFGHLVVSCCIVLYLVA